MSEVEIVVSAPAAAPVEVPVAAAAADAVHSKRTSAWIVLVQEVYKQRKAQKAESTYTEAMKEAKNYREAYYAKVGKDVAAIKECDVEVFVKSVLA
jgi:hypothetical protein